MDKVLVVGHGGREASIASKLAKDAIVYVVCGHENPTIIDCVHATGGRHMICQPTDGKKISEFALTHKIDLAFVSSDEPLAAGVVDDLLAAGIRTVGPTRSGAQIEWDKSYATELMAREFPLLTPKTWQVTNGSQLSDAFTAIRLEGCEIVVKPQGLTGGKGVKVMGAHLVSFDEAREYAQELLDSRPGESVLLVEKVTGIEFTIMFITDGERIIRVPATYDYPYRFDGDTGPGTGGMGSFSDSKITLPFITESQYEQCAQVAIRVLSVLKSEGRRFNGVLNSGFFVTKEGMKFLEFNARFGDPECMNIMTVMNGSLLELLKDIDADRLDDTSFSFSGKASVVKYLVSPEYALGEGGPHNFSIDVAGLKNMGIDVYFSASIADASGYKSVGNSRCVALATKADSIAKASETIEAGISRFVVGSLQWREDIGSPSYLSRLMTCVG